ncbi:MAG: GDP-mannose 4,6-dehydratase [Elusimicrobia bacterium]|nr:GDP-mannose 4,6-dehydratase [Elusimicrobiota bacterium]
MRFLITGGAGFIGTKLVRELQKDPAHRCCVIDDLTEQVHGPDAAFPDFASNVSCLRYDLRDAGSIKDAVAEFKPTHVVHLAAETGTGQSRDELQRYCSVNVDGTAILLEALIAGAGELGQVILASSRAVHGEGPWRRADGQVVVPGARRGEDLAAGRFDPAAYEDGKAVRLSEPLAAVESTPASPVSIYASTKLMQEHLLTQSALGEKALVFRLQNVYGAGQSLRNPYTGVLSVFCSLLLKNQPLAVFEDGGIIRDFVAADDVVAGILSGIAAGTAGGTVINLGSGRPVSILSAARLLCRIFGKDPERTIAVTGQFRLGDVRHATADIAKARALLGWTPRTSLQEGLEELARWSRTQA